MAAAHIDGSFGVHPELVDWEGENADSEQPLAVFGDHLQDTCAFSNHPLLLDLLLVMEAPVDADQIRIDIVDRQESEAEPEREIIVRRNVQAASSDAWLVMDECLHRVQRD